MGGARRIVTSLACSLVLASGCAAEAPIDGEPRLELGTGTWQFEPVEDGQALPLVFGAQGGWHVWVAVRAYDLEVDSGSLEMTHQLADDSAPPSRTRVGARFDPADAAGGRVYLGWPAILADPACAVGELYRVEVTLTAADGRRLSAERELRILPGEHPPPPCASPE